MELDRRKRQLLGNDGIFYSGGSIDGLALDPLRGEGRRRDGRAAAERLELGVGDLAVLVHFDLQPHDVAARGRAHKTRAHVCLGRVQFSDVARILVVIDNLSATKSFITRKDNTWNNYLFVIESLDGAADQGRSSRSGRHYYFPAGQHWQGSCICHSSYDLPKCALPLTNFAKQID